MAVLLGIAEISPQAAAADGGVIIVQTFGGCEKPETPVPTEAWAWGVNSLGAVGDGSATPEIHTPVQPLNPANVIGVACSGHSLAVKGDGTVWAWGSNASGQVGDGSRNDRHTPVQLPQLSQVTMVAAGHEHSLALRTDGTVWAWGRNRYGQLGDGTNTDRLTPVKLPGLAEVRQIAAGGDHSLALKSDLTTWGWGKNVFGQLATGTLNDHIDSPVRVQTQVKFESIAAGGDHSVAVEIATGRVWVWGYNYEGQLGDVAPSDTGTSLPVVWLPVQLHSLGPVARVAAGSRHTLAVIKDGTVLAWGNNVFGELGDGTRTSSATPVRVAGLNSIVVEVAGGDSHSMALKGDGTVWAWGNNFYGELGDGTAYPRLLPVRAQGLIHATAIAGGIQHSMAAASATLEG